MRVRPDYYDGRFVNSKAAERWAEFTRREVKRSGRPYSFRALMAKRFQGWLSKYDKVGYPNVQFHEEWLNDPETFIQWVIDELGGEPQDCVIRRDNPKAGFVPKNLSVYPK